MADMICLMIGHGMARILTSTKSLAHLLETNQWDPSLPQVFQITQERLDRVREQALPIQSDLKWGVKPVGQTWWGWLRGKKDVVEDVDPVRGL
jgi:hypothetical protein